MAEEEKIEVENATSPGRVTRVNRAKYEAMRDALMQVVPSEPPGATPAALKEALLPKLDEGLFPGGDKAGWWLKCVQLDLEAKGQLKRADKPPVRLYRP
ncbi:DUF6958 family protein [Pseudoroseicyclus sp. H15]